MAPCAQGEAGRKKGNIRNTSESGASEGAATLVPETPNMLDTPPSYASPDTSVTSHDPQPSMALANMATRVRNSRKSPSGAHVAADTRNFTTASSVFN